jgi:hypothetical protein
MKRILTVAVAAALGLAACDQKPAGGGGAAPAAGGGGTKGLVDSAKEKVAEGAAALREKAVAALQPQVEAARAKLEELAKKAESLDAVKKATAMPAVESARAAFSDVSARFEALRGSGEWQKAKEASEAALAAFGEAAKKAAELVK